MYKSGIWILSAILLGNCMNVAAVETVPGRAVTMDQEEEVLEIPGGANEENDILYNVSFPADIHAFLDPGNLSGRGQIFSGQYAVENYGNTDIKIIIKNIDVYYASTEDIYEFSDEEIVDHSSRVKKLSIRMVWKNEAERSEKTLYLSEGIRDEEVLTLEASEYDENGEFVNLREKSSGFFYFTGTLNANPNIEWEEGELVVRFDYEILNVEGEEEKQEEELKASEEPEDDENEEGSDNQGEAESPDSSATVDEEKKDEGVDTPESSVDEEAKNADGAAESEENETDIEERTEPSEETEGIIVYETDTETGGKGDSITGAGP